MPLRSNVWAVVLVLGAAVACGNRSPEPAGPPAMPPGEEATPAQDAQLPTTTVFGVPLGAAVADVLAACPGLPAPSTVGNDGGTQARWTTTLEGLSVELQLTFSPERLALLTFDVTGEAANEASYRTLAARAVADLGPGHPTRCESEDGVPFDEYMAHGWGGLKVEWRDPPFAFTGELALTKDYGPSGLRLHGFFAVPGLLPTPDDFADDSIQGTLGRLEPSCRDAAPRGRSMPRAAFPAAAKQETGCTVDLSGAPGATILELPFGASQAEVERALGVPLTRENGSLFFSRTVEGVPGKVHLGFYDGCLAVILFIAGPDGATVENYRKLRDWARSTMGPGEGVRCVSEDGTPDERHIGAGYGYMHTGWRGTPPLDGSLRLERSYEALDELQIVFEADYLPLREHAPQIDFAEEEAGRMRPGPGGGGPATP